MCFGFEFSSAHYVLILFKKAISNDLFCHDVFSCWMVVVFVFYVLCVQFLSSPDEDSDGSRRLILFIVLCVL